MDPDLVWHSLSGSALIALGLTLLRFLLDYLRERRQPRHDCARLPPADARVERILIDRLAEAERRLDRWECELRAERERSASLEERLRRLSTRRGPRP